MNALLGTARLNAFRLNALAPALAKIRRTRVGILLDGQAIREQVRLGSLTIRDQINDAPNTAAFSMTGPSHQPYPDTVLADAPIAYWRLGDLGTTARDATGTGHTGTLYGGVTVNAPGAIGDGDRAMHFPGTAGSAVRVESAADLAPTASLALEAWVQTDTLTQQGGIVEKSIGDVINTSYSLWQDNARWVFRIVGTFGLIDTTIPITAADVGTWVHLVGVYLPTTGTAFFRNGVLGGAQTGITGTIAGGPGALYIGQLTGALPFRGAIDEVAVYAFLSGARVGAHYQNAQGAGADAPAVAQEVRITLGIDAPVLLFNGTLSQVDLTYEGRPVANRVIYHCSATDDTLRASRRRPFGTWQNVSATTVAQQLIARFVPGFGSAFVQAGLPPVTVIFDGSEGLNRCLTQITNLIGGYWYFADHQLHLFITEAFDAPDPIDETHPFLADPHIRSTSDVTQVRTRVYGRGHGEALLSDVAPNETILPIQSASMFAATGGQAQALDQVIRYTGTDLGGRDTLVGIAAAPSVAPNAVPTAGSGLADGTYQYAYTYVTASGESLPSPLASATVGAIPGPSTAPHPGPPQAGTGPDQGAHDYAVAFVTAGGAESGVGPRATIATTLTPAPTSAPSMSAATGTGVDPGTYDYQVTFVTATGETSPGPTSTPPVTALGPGIVPPPSTAPTPAEWNPGHGVSGQIKPGDSVSYVYTFLPQSGGETTPSPMSITLVAHAYGAGSDIMPITVTCPAPATNPPTYISVYRLRNGSWDGCIYGNGFAGSGIDGTLPGNGAAPPSTNTTTPQPARAVLIASGLPLGDSSVTGRRLYRRVNGAGAFRLVVTIPNNTATQYNDTLPNASLGANAPSASTAALCQIPLDTIPVGATGITARRIYRTAAGGSTLKLATTIADNTTTTWLDTVPDASLGAAAGTVGANRVQVSAIAVGPSGTTSRWLYRTAVGGAQLKRLAGLGENVTTAYLDALSDASLGANAPTADTSGLVQVSGQVPSGSTSIPTASTAPFLAGGGWAMAGSHLIRYTGLSGNSLIGIPPSGAGSLTATLRYGEHLTAAPVLTGVTVPVGGTFLAPGGTTVYLWIQRDNLEAQAAMALKDGGDGIYEYLVQDERRGLPSLTALCDAHLLAYAFPIETVTYATRDLKTRSGKTIAVTLAHPPVTSTHDTRGPALVIQDVTIDQIETSPGLAPRFSVVASTMRFSFEDLFRRLAGTLEDAPL